mmetsp:Transcript_70843/g.207849  ORF Transcript_70843/g.207849 Transcript_70843/m.207849 type:complete len:232 (+) Transcript_70843:954-1649(+)
MPARGGTASTSFTPSRQTWSTAPRKRAAGGSISTASCWRQARTDQSFFGGAVGVPPTRERSASAAHCSTETRAAWPIASASCTQLPRRTLSSCTTCLRRARWRACCFSSAMDTDLAAGRLEGLEPPGPLLGGAAPSTRLRCTRTASSSSTCWSFSCRASSSRCAPEKAFPCASCWSSTNWSKSSVRPSLGSFSTLTANSLSPTMWRTRTSAPTNAGLAKRHRRASCWRRPL